MELVCEDADKSQAFDEPTALTRSPSSSVGVGEGTALLVCLGGLETKKDRMKRSSQVDFQQMLDACDPRRKFLFDNV